jgi:hypothetical protein
MRRYDDPYNDLGPSLPHQSCPDCIIAKTAVVMFSDRQQFTSVVRDAADAMARHRRLVGEPQEEGETRFRYTLHIPNDKERHITITMMLFNVPKTT